MIMRESAVFILLSLMLTSPVFAEKITLVFASYDTTIAPFIMGKGTSFPKDKPGVSVELLRLLEQELDIKIEFKRYSYPRAIKYMEEGRVDGQFPWSFKEQRLQTGQFPMMDDQQDASKRLITLSYVIYKLKDSNLGWDGKVFENLNKPIGVQQNYSIVEVLRKKYKVKVDDVTKHTYQNFDRLLIGRVSATVDVEMPADIVLNSNEKYRKNIVKMSPPLVTKPYYLVLSHQFVKKHPELAKKIWIAIEEIREKHLLRLMEKYAN
ncbi:MAG: transporter substrate-binding domain-containing protein [Candidatus Sedimenticola sp. 6PFRAG7]